MTEAQVMETPAPATEPLTALDRCDRCGAQAYARTQHEAGDLLWCSHHFIEHEDHLLPVLVVDDRHKLA